MISNISLSFAEFVNMAESIEAAFKSGKLKTMESSQRFQKRKDNEVNIAQCEYHAGTTGHYIDNCNAFKKVVQNLINTGVLKIDSPNVAANHFPNHGEQGVNAIEEECLWKTLESVDEVRSHLSWVYKQLRGAGLIIRDVEFDNKAGEEFCEYHQERGHKIQHCEDFKKLIQKMIDNKEIELFIEV
ncbi:hypothetical protein GQ457_12G018590 [Hibiscus cannabinus]